MRPSPRISDLPPGGSVSGSGSGLILGPASGILSLGLPSVPSVEERVAQSTELWARDLGALFEHAKERFGDVVWETDGGDRIWGHKAIIYARAPKAFKDRYFISRPFARSPIPTPTSPGLLPPLFPTRNTPSPYTTSASTTASGRGSSLSIETVSEGTLRPGTGTGFASGLGPGNGTNGNTLHLTHEDAPELFRAQLEWLYTGEGFGDVVEWISAEDEESGAMSVRDSLGRRGNLADRRDKLGQDLTYMWRSKLYCDVRIHLTPLEPESASEDSDDSTDSFASTAIFASHRFLLVSRSPYFASVLLNPSSFRPASTADVHLPTPPFTPAALHFCLGWMYAGHLDFSNRSFDLVTAFQIHRAAAYLQLDALVDEVESRIAHDFCHGLDVDKCRCRRCPVRAARVWRFATASDVGAVDLARRARAYVVRAWAESWGKEVGLADEAERAALVKDVVGGINYQTVIAAFRGCEQVRARMDAGIRSRGKDAGPWVDALEVMIEAIETRARTVLIDDFPRVAEGAQLWDLVSGKGFSDDLLDRVLKEVVDGAGSSRGCNSAPKVYQALVSAVLLKVDPDSLEAALPARSRSRQMIEAAKEGVLAHIRRRWMQVRDAGGFEGLDNWAIKEISDEIEVPLEELLGASAAATALGTPNRPRGIPRTTSRISALSEARETRTPRSASETAASSRPSTLRRPLPASSSGGAVPPSPPQADGLRRLRLSSSASTASMASSSRSTRSISAPTRTPAAPSTSVNAGSGPTARSPTAAKQGAVVSVGGGSRGRTSGAGERAGSASPTPSRPSPSTKTMTGPPRQLLTRANATAKSPSTLGPGAGTSSSASGIGSGRTPSIASTRSVASTKTSATTATTRTNGAAATGTRAAVSARTPGTASAGSVLKTRPGVASNTVTPSPRQRTESASTTASVRSKAPSITPSVRSTVSRLNATQPAPLPKAGATSSPLTTGKTASRLGPATPSTPGAVAGRSVTGPTKGSTGSSATTPRVRVSSAAGTPSAAGASASKLVSGPAVTKMTVPSRLRTASTASTASSRAGVNAAGATPTRAAPSTAIPNPPPDPPTSALPRSRPAVRSPSGSTDEPEATTPHLSEIIEPVIRGDDSLGSDLSTSFPSVAVGKSLDSAILHGLGKGAPTPSVHSRPGVSARPRLAELSQPQPSVTAPGLSKAPTTIKLLPPPGTQAFTGRGVVLTVGIPCIVLHSSRRARFRANVRYLGKMEGASGAWVGLEVEDLERLGIKTLPDGSKDGVHYFNLSNEAAMAGETTGLRGEAVGEGEGGERKRRVQAIGDSLTNRKKNGLNIGLGLGGTRSSPKTSRVKMGTSGMRNGSGSAGVPGFGGGRSASGGGGLSVDQPDRKRSLSPFAIAAADWGVGENPRALFVRPSEVLFVLGAE